MGVIPVPTEYGTDCPICFPLGKTPKYVKCFFSGIQMGEWWHGGLPSPPNGYFDLEADPARYCIWVISKPGPWAIEWKLMDTYSRLVCWTQSVYAFESQRDGVLCASHFGNDNIYPDIEYYYGGSGYITVPGTIKGGGVSTIIPLSSIITKVTPIFDPDPRLECFPVPDEKIVVRYAGKRDGTNIAIKFDTNPD